MAYLYFVAAEHAGGTCNAVIPLEEVVRGMDDIRAMSAILRDIHGFEKSHAMVVTNYILVRED